MKEYSLEECRSNGWLTPKGKISTKKSVSAQDRTHAFIAKARAKHGNSYSYNQVQYLTSKQAVDIVCTVHGKFSATPTDHLQGSGCPYCANNQKQSTEDFIDKAKYTHGNKYTYTNSEYTGAHTKLLVTCRTHGDFLVKPSNHITNASGCPACKGMASDTIYFYRLAGTDTYKVGITTYSSLELRLRRVANAQGTEPEVLVHRKTGYPKSRDLEQYIRARYIDFRSKEITQGDGYTEMYDLTTAQAEDIILQLSA